MNEFKKYFGKRKSAIGFNLKKKRRSYTPSTFHILRVEIKKLNAFLELINYCSKNFKQKKTYKPFKQIFQKAGDVREKYLEEVKLKKRFVEILPINHLNGLRMRRLKMQDIYFSELNDKNLKKMKNSYQYIKPFLKDVTKKKAEEYLNEKKKKLNPLLNKTNLTKPQLHEIRKQLKKINYNKKIPDKKGNSTENKKSALPKLLGKWHNCEVIIKDLNRAIGRSTKNIKEISQLKNIKSEISSESESLLKKIKVETEKYILKEIMNDER